MTVVPAAIPETGTVAVVAPAGIMTDAGALATPALSGVTESVRAVAGVHDSANIRFAVDPRAMVWAEGPNSLPTTRTVCDVSVRP